MVIFLVILFLCLKVLLMNVLVSGGDGGYGVDGVSGGGRVVTLGAAWERRVGVAGAHELERRVFASPAPHHRLLPRLLHLLTASTDKNDTALPVCNNTKEITL